MTLYTDLAKLQNRDFANAEHVFYSPANNHFMSIKYNFNFETYEVWLYNDQRCMEHSFAGTENILSRKKTEPDWEFIGTL